jgi:methylmalonyl-CoA mutase, N-terminal domain
VARVLFSVNKYTRDDGDRVEIMRIDARQQDEQVERVRRLRERRSRSAVDAHLAAIEKAARGTGNLLPVLKAALADYVTIGECCNVLRAVFGEYRPTEG